MQPKQVCFLCNSHVNLETVWPFHHWVLQSATTSTHISCYPKNCHIACCKEYQTTDLVYLNIWMFPKIGVPQNGWFIMENPLKWMIYQYFWKHPYVYCIAGDSCRVCKTLNDPVLHHTTLHRIVLSSIMWKDDTPLHHTRKYIKRMASIHVYVYVNVNVYIYNMYMYVHIVSCFWIPYQIVCIILYQIILSYLAFYMQVIRL